MFGLQLGRLGIAGGSINITPDLSFISTSGVTGSPASAWDSFVGGISLTQSTAGSRPAISASAFGSAQGLSFDGANDVIGYTGKPITATAAGSLLCVFKTPSAFSSRRVIVSQSDSAVANDWWELGIDASGMVYVESNAAGTVHTVRGITELAESTAYSVILCFDGVDYFMTINGAEENPLTIESVGAFAWAGRVGGTPVFNIGGTVTSGGTQRPFSGIIGEVSFWNQDLTA